MEVFMEEKICIECKEKKPISSFYMVTKSNGKTYHQNKCKGCTDILFFSGDEIRILKDLVKKHEKELKTSDIIRDVLTEKKAKVRLRQTYIIEKSLISRIQDYCIKNRLNKSDFVNIAILKMLNEN